jgi:hypothetical protein
VNKGREILIAIMILAVIDTFGLVLRANDQVDPFDGNGPSNPKFYTGTLASAGALQRMVGGMGEVGPNFARVGQFLHIVPSS